jgi:hypothetical protein
VENPLDIPFNFKSFIGSDSEKPYMNYSAKMAGTAVNQRELQMQ